MRVSITQEHINRARREAWCPLHVAFDDLGHRVASSDRRVWVGNLDAAPGSPDLGVYRLPRKAQVWLDAFDIAPWLALPTVFDLRKVPQ